MLAWLAQWDEPRQNGRRERIFTQELSVVVARGWTVRLTHGFQDPDRDRQSGIRQRLAGGLDVLATPFFGILAMVNHDEIKAGIDVPDQGGWSSHLVLHFLY
jgi:hypothetical protein